MLALVVDDSRAMRSIVKKIVAAEGYAILEAGDGVAALAVLAASAEVPSVALLDWNMPEMNGFDLLQAVRAQPRYSAMRVVMITTETELEFMGRALEAGADEYLMKPFDGAALRAKLALIGLAAA